TSNQSISSWTHPICPGIAVRFQRAEDQPERAAPSERFTTTNPTVLDKLNYTHNNGKYAFPYATTKWSTPLKPP
ncbi:hypothetical protein AVEN_128692-1, partial [Araneus ventricosus]